MSRKQKLVHWLVALLALSTNPGGTHAQAGGWVATNGGMTASRYQGPSATRLPDNRVLIAGGWCCPGNSGEQATAELFDPGNQTFAATGSMLVARASMPSATLLKN